MRKLIVGGVIGAVAALMLIVFLLIEVLNANQRASVAEKQLGELLRERENQRRLDALARSLEASNPGANKTTGLLAPSDWVPYPKQDEMVQAQREANAIAQQMLFEQRMANVRQLMTPTAPLVVPQSDPAADYARVRQQQALDRIATELEQRKRQ